METYKMCFFCDLLNIVEADLKYLH